MLTVNGTRQEKATAKEGRGKKGLPTCNPLLYTTDIFLKLYLIVTGRLKAGYGHRRSTVMEC